MVVSLKRSDCSLYVVTLAVLMLLGFTSYIIILTHRYKKSLTMMTGMMIAMATGMLSSLLVGTILGVCIGKMFIATEIAMFVGMIVGFWTGRPIHLIASIDGLLAGMMGGMMGAMLGVMVVNEAPVFTLAFLTVSFTLSNILIVFLIRIEVITSSGMQKGQFLLHPYFPPFLLTILFALTILLCFAAYLQPTIAIHPHSPGHMHH